MTLLEVDEIDSRHGLLQAVRGVSFRIEQGETVALVGANGAGKTTLLRTIAGAHRPSAGRILFEDNDITAVPGHRRVGLGIALVPEGRRLFAELTVEENLLIAASPHRAGPWSLETVLDAFPILKPLRRRLAANLSGGEQQAVAIGRGLISNPRLLLLDEVSLGLAPVAVEGVYRSLETVLGEGATVVLVEQDLARAMEVAGRIICLLEGRIVLDQPASSLSRERITAAYLGLQPAEQP